ncbi:hypothetical protein Enr13x_58920 [Stieleria neptunia]|uniref:Uncharacterized protein n=1 Tax=Stieleria neptunia TaxID=2527979 RepID=A0A518HYR1_9BACT|nr:hypothetical protein Enr13x_58920 [Stieleria neptunia]
MPISHIKSKFCALLRIKERYNQQSPVSLETNHCPMSIQWQLPTR